MDAYLAKRPAKKRLEVTNCNQLLSYLQYVDVCAECCFSNTSGKFWARKGAMEVTPPETPLS